MVPELAALDLIEASDYAVQVRYDLEFWPTQAMASDALLLAEQVVGLVIDRLAAGPTSPPPSSDR